MTTLTLKTPGGGKPNLDNIEAWIFDLDNTLYPAHCDLFAQVSRRMGEFIAGFLGVEPDAATRLQKEFFRRHGTTLRGLMVEHGMEPTPFLDYVHDIDLSAVPLDGRLHRALDRLGGRKLIFTNGTRHHALRVTDRLGISHHFDAVFDIVDSDYLPKPDPRPYRKMLAQHAIVPERAAMIEDMARNLAPAAALGMTTIWVPGHADWSREGCEEEHIHHVTEDLAAWLLALTEEILEERESP